MTSLHQPITASTRHQLKTWPPYFKAIRDGSKTFECRTDDRGFTVGDTLVLREYDPSLQAYTESLPEERVVTYIMRNSPLCQPGMAVMGLARTQPSAADEEMVERVAMAIGLRENVLAGKLDAAIWLLWPESTKEAYREIARAAIFALVTP